MGEIELGELIIEWDDRKAAINKKKHGVSFELAAKVFLDEFLIDDYDENHSDDEDRIKVIGMVAKVLAVIYTERQDRYRLISARLANKRDVKNTMGSLVLRREMKFEFTPEQLEEIKRWEQMTDDDIDYSDIPPLTDEELSKFRPARLRLKNPKNIAS